MGHKSCPERSFNPPPSLTAPPPSVAPTLTAADGALLRTQPQPTRQLRQLRILLPLSPTRKTSKRSQSPEELDSKLSLLALGVFELSPFSGDTCLEPPRSVHVLPVAGSLVTGDSFSPKGTLSGLLSLELSGSRWFGSNASPAPPPTPNHTGMFVSNCVPGIRTKCSSFPEAFHLQALPEATKHRRTPLCSQIGITDHGLEKATRLPLHSSRAPVVTTSVLSCCSLLGTAPLPLGSLGSDWSILPHCEGARKTFASRSKERCAGYWQCGGPSRGNPGLLPKGLPFFPSRGYRSSRCLKHLKRWRGVSVTAASPQLLNNCIIPSAS